MCLTLVIMAEIRKQMATEVGEDVGKEEALSRADESLNQYSRCMNQCGWSSKAKRRTTMRLGCTTPRRRPKNSLSYHRDTCMSAFAAAPFPVAEKQKQCGWSSVGERIKKMWCRNTMASCSAVKKDELIESARRWSTLEIST